MPIVKPVDYNKLNSNQKNFATADFNNPCLSVAVAGSGKTTTAVARIQKMLESGVRADEILLLSFTNAATDSIVDRVAKVLGEDVVAGITAGTFHSVFNSVLRRYFYKVNLSSDFSIENDEMHKEAMKKAMITVDFPFKESRIKPQDLLYIVSQTKLRDLSIDEAIMVFNPKLNDFYYDVVSAIDEYTDYCKKNSILDYNDLLLKTYELLKDNPDVCKSLSEKYKYIIVDEYQDTNVLEAKILKLLRSFDEKSLTVIGDPQQSIYSFINADVKNIVNFGQDYSDTNELPLTYNYRSNQQILDTANEVVKDSKIGKFESMKGTHSVNYKPFLVRFRDKNEEAQAAIETIEYFNKVHNIPLGDIAVLIRNGTISNILEVELNKPPYNKTIPFIKMGGKKFLEKSHVQDVIQLLKTVENTRLDLSWNRSLSLLKGIKDIYSQQISSFIFSNSEVPDIDLLISDHFSKRSFKKSLEDYHEFLSDTRKLLTPTEKVDATINFYRNLRLSAISLHKVENQASEMHDLQEQIEEVKALNFIADSYKSLTDMLDALVLDDRLTNKDTSGDKLTISTIHSAKGLEWKVVILLEASDECLPGDRGPSSSHPLARELHENEIEEGRRLTYVALTRAKDFLFIFSPRLNSRYQPLILSRFLATMDVRRTMTEIINSGTLDYELFKISPNKIKREELQID